MLGAQFCVRTLSGFEILTDRRNATRSLSNLFSSSSIPLSLRSNCCRPTRKKSILICCSSSRGNLGSRSNNGDLHDHDDRDYLEASLLVSETVLHYQMRKQGFREDTKWQSSRKVFSSSVHSNQSRGVIPPIGLGFLRRFHNPTIFLKISCDGDYLLPVIVGEFAVENLMDALRKEDNGVISADQYQFLSNVVDEDGYEVRMVKITQKIVNTYYAELYIGKPGNNDILIVDARPSDAINVANRSKAPIFVNKEIVLADAIRIGHGMGRLRDTKSVYDVTLDSAPEGAEPLSEELYLIRNMKYAAKEEQYAEAAMWRDKLTKLRRLNP